MFGKLKEESFQSHLQVKNLIVKITNSLSPKYSLKTIEKCINYEISNLKKKLMKM